MNPPVDIIIPTLRTPEQVAPLVAEIERTAGVPVRVYATCTPASASVNRNLGLDWAKSEVVFQVDDDTSEYPDGWVAKMVSVMNEHPECVMCSAQLKVPGSGTPSFMMGGFRPKRSGISAAADRKLPTACVCTRRSALRFDEGYEGSGYEDDDMAAQLRAAFPNGTFLVCHDVWVGHRNERKNQTGPRWERNKKRYHDKWNIPDDGKHQ